MKQTALIWGAAGGIGRALAQLLLSKDWNVIAVGRDTSALEHVSTLTFEADVSDPNAVQAAVMAVSQEVDQIDWWIYAAGDIIASPLAEMKPQDWKRILDANLTGVYLTAHYSLPLFAENTTMYILGAVSERMRLPGLGAYAAAKAGLEALGEVMRKELRRPVVIVRPKAVQTSLWEKVPFNAPPGAVQPEDLALRILEAYQTGYKDPRLDL